MIAIICAILLCVLPAFLLIKNERTFKQQTTISTAIFNYKMHCIQNDCTHFDVDYDDMESYGNTLLRLWDWAIRAFCLRISLILLSRLSDRESVSILHLVRRKSNDHINYSVVARPVRY